MTGWTVLWRGVKYRAGRSLVVLLLTTVATTAAAVLPSYVRAAQQSVLRDLIQSAPAYETAIHVSVPPVSPIGLQPLGVSVAKSTVESVLLSNRALSDQVSAYVGQVDARLKLVKAPPATVVDGRFAFRDGICEQVAVSGACPQRSGEVMVSARSAELHHIKLGDEIELEVGQTAEAQFRKPKVVGLYTAKDPSAPFWTATGLLAFGSTPVITEGGSSIYTIDAVIANDNLAVEQIQGDLHKTVTAWLDLGPVDMDGMAEIAKGLADATVILGQTQLRANSGLPAILDEAKRDQESIAATVPIGAVPLLVLALFVLMVLVAALAEERGPEIALAKLHGYAAGRVGQFGLGEVLFLITVAAPIGLLLAWAVMFAIKLFWLAEGTPLELSWQPFAAVGAALLATYVSAIAASRRIFATRIVYLLRRVPQRTTWRAGAMDGAVTALALAALVAAWQDRSSGLALVAAPLVAIVAGLIGGRVLGYLAKTRLPRARRAADVSAILTSAQLSRRPGRQRVIVVIAVATSLMGFAATASDVSAQARETAANGEIGAHQVYRAVAPTAERFLAAVQAAAPDGSAMAVTRRQEFYAGETIQVLAVQADRLATAATWLGHSPAELATAGQRLRPPVPASYAVSGTLSLRAEAQGFTEVPLEFVAEIRIETGVSNNVSFGALRSGLNEYTASVPNGVLTSLKLVRRAGTPGTAAGQLTVKAISSGSGPLQVGGEADWQAITNNQVKVGLTGTDQIEVRVEATGNRDVQISHLRTPKELPVLLAGKVPAETKPGEPWTFLSVGHQPQRFTVAQQLPALPGTGSGTGFIADLEYSLRAAVDAEGVAVDPIHFEVWAGPNAPADLRQRLADQGVQLHSEQTLTAYAGQLGRRAPALALRIYALAGMVALLLALGIVVLVARIGAEQRAYELASLRVAGVPVKLLRRSLRREYLTLLGWPSLIGFAAGVGSSLFMLPAIPLVTVGVTTAVQWRPAPGALAALAAACLGCLLIALPVSVRLVREARPELLRGEA